MLIRAALILLLALGALSPHAASGGSAAEESSLIPFVGSFRITATWGAPSGGYHRTPAVDVKMKSGTPVYAAGAGTVATIDRDTTHCDPRAHGSSTDEGVKWCLSHGYANSGTRIVVRHTDGRTSHYLHLSSVVPALAEKQPVQAGQLLGHSGNTGISEAPHLHYEERLNGKAVDPGTWVGCSAGKRVEYDRLQQRVGQPVANDGYGCLGISVDPPPPPADPLRGLVGTWSGRVTQNGGVAPFIIVITLKAPVASTAGVAEIRSSGCVGLVRYARSDAAVHHFGVTWPRGRCIAGTISLTVRDARTLGYHWEGRYDDGSRAFSDAALRRVDNLAVRFLGPATSRYSQSYWADVTGVRRLPSGLIAVSMSATGQSDLRRPETSCLIGSSTQTKVAVSSMSLSTRRPGRYVGELIFPALEPGVWHFQYSCQSDYSSPPVVRIGS